MKSCISRGFPRNVQQQAAHKHLLPRKHLITSLLSNRDELRVICAPALHGKTTLAHLYAETAFAPEQVCWIDATDPSFLITLDAISADASLMKLPDSASNRAQSQLYIVDACPQLESERHSSLLSLLGELLDRGHEVILTTRSAKWIMGSGVSHSVDAASLLLDPEEQVMWSDLSSDANDDEREGRLGPNVFEKAIPGIYCQPSSYEEGIVTILEELSIDSEEEAISLLAVVLEAGAIHELRGFVSSLSDATISNIERWYPYCGIKRFEPMFQAVKISDAQRFALLCCHLPALSKQLPLFRTEEELVEALVDVLVRRGQTLLAALLVCGTSDDKKRETFFDEFVEQLNLLGKPRILLRLGSSLTEHFLSKRCRWFHIALAHSLIGQTEQARSAAEHFSCLSDDSENIPDCEQDATKALYSVLFDLFLPTSKGVDLSRLPSITKDVSEEYNDARTESLDLLSDFEQELVALIWNSAEDLQRGYDLLERILSRGYSVKESLFATCVFVQVVFIGVDEHSASDVSTLDRGSRLRSRTKSLLGGVLSRLEETIAYALIRSSETLPPNIMEMFLFDRSCHLFGEKAYVLVGDDILSRIKTIKDDIASQVPARSAHASGLHSTQERTIAQTCGKSSQAKQLRINLLGRFEIRAMEEDIQIEPKIRKQLRLLIALIAINSGQELARAWVQQVMWPDSPERNAKQNLYTMWSILNRSVVDKNEECPFFMSYPQSIGINYDLVETDVDCFVDLCKQVRSGSLSTDEYLAAIDQLEQIYLGELLPGEDTPEIVAKRKSYQEQLIEALMTGSETLRKQGQTNLALRYVQFAFKIEHTREDVCYLLMTLLWKLDRHPEALNVFYESQRALIERFGIVGTARLKELYKMILEEVS